MDIIKAHNALYDAGTSSFFLAENELADLTLKEFSSKYLGYKMTEKTVFDTEDLSGVTVPTAVDWTTKGAVNAVKN